MWFGTWSLWVNLITVNKWYIIIRDHIKRLLLYFKFKANQNLIKWVELIFLRLTCDVPLEYFLWNFPMNKSSWYFRGQLVMFCLKPSCETFLCTSRADILEVSLWCSAWSLLVKLSYERVELIFLMLTCDVPLETIPVKLSDERVELRHDPLPSSDPFLVQPTTTLCKSVIKLFHGKTTLYGTKTIIYW